MEKTYYPSLQHTYLEVVGSNPMYGEMILAQKNARMK